MNEKGVKMQEKNVQGKKKQGNKSQEKKVQGNKSQENRIQGKQVQEGKNQGIPKRENKRPESTLPLHIIKRDRRRAERRKCILNRYRSWILRRIYRYYKNLCIR